MNIVRLLPVILSILLLSAHYFRAGFVVLVIVISSSLLLLLIRKPWVVRVIQVELVIGGIEWIRTTIHLVLMRQSMSMPWIRLAIILGSVSLLTFCSLLVFRSVSLRRRYGTERSA